MSDEYDYLDDAVSDSHDPYWLASRWHYRGGEILDADGCLIAAVANDKVAEYIIATHHRCINVPYVAGQLELEL